jgi:hypothetical protein
MTRFDTPERRGTLVSRRGERVVKGRVLILVDTFPGVHARETAFHVAEERRAKGQFVRIVKRRAYLYAVYALGAFLLVGCAGQLLPETSDALVAIDAGLPLDVGTAALPDADLPSCVWVYPAESHGCGEDNRRIDSDAGCCACDPGTACTAIDVAPGQDSGGEGSHVVGCAFRPRTDGGAP